MNNGTSISRTDLNYYVGLYKKAATVKAKASILSAAVKNLSVQDWYKFFDELARWNDEKNERNNSETE